MPRENMTRKEGAEQMGNLRKQVTTYQLLQLGKNKFIQSFEDSQTLPKKQKMLEMIVFFLSLPCVKKKRESLRGHEK